jgi:hypothetical protein
LKPGWDFAEVAAITQQNPGGLALVTLAHNTFTKSARVKDHRGVDLISDALESFFDCQTVNDPARMLLCSY